MLKIDGGGAIVSGGYSSDIAVNSGWASVVTIDGSGSTWTNNSGTLYVGSGGMQHSRSQVAGLLPPWAAFRSTANRCCP